MPNDQDILFRWASQTDFDALGQVMYSAVRLGQSPYDDGQRAAWVPEPREGQAWHKRLSGQKIILAESDGNILAFMSLTPDNYIDFAYILPSMRGQGLFRQLYKRIEREAFIRGAARLTTHASLMARPAFSAMGFSVQKSEAVELRGAMLQRYAMEKKLSD